MMKLIAAVFLFFLFSSAYSACVTPRTAAYKADPAYAASSVVTGLPSNQCTGIGPIGIAFDNNKNLYTCIYPRGPIYKFNMNSMPVHSPNSNHIFADTYCFGLVFDGRYLWVGTKNMLELSRYDLSRPNPVKEVMATISNSRMYGLAVDSSTGDIYISLSSGELACFKRRANEYKVLHKFNNGVVDGITIDPVGKYLYGAASKNIIRIDLNSRVLTETIVAPLLGGADGIALASNPLNPSQPPYLFVATNSGLVVKIDLSTTPATAKNIVTGGTRGDFATVGPDGCFYASQSTSILKVTNADGTCSLSPTSPHPIIGISSPPLQSGASVNVPFNSSQSVTFHATSADPRNAVIPSKDVTKCAGDISSVSFSPSLETRILANPLDITATFTASPNTVSARVAVTVTDRIYQSSSSSSVTFCSVPKLSGGGCVGSTLTVQPAGVPYQLIKDGVNIGSPQSSTSFTVTSPGSYSVKYTDSRTGCSVTSNSVTVIPPPSVSTSVSVGTIYLGYTPKSCTQVSCAVSPTTGNTIEWLAPVNARGSSVQVCASNLKAGVNTLTCKASSVNGCTVTKTVNVNVIDVRCGQKLEKVKVCHVEPKKNPVNLCIAAEAVPPHLTLHGDTLGDC